MTKQSTTVRLDPELRKAALQKANSAGLSFSGVINLLLHAFVDGTVDVGVTKYPKGYLQQLEKEADELRELHRKGKVKKYVSSKELFDDILGG